MQDQQQASDITGTPAFMSLAVLNDEPQRESTELESLLYSMYATTGAKLPWGAYVQFGPVAYGMKEAAMFSDQSFKGEVLARIDDAGLRSTASSLRALFFSGGTYRQDVRSNDFIAAIQQAQQLVSTS